MRWSRLLLAAISVVCFPSTIWAADLWTFYFVPDESRPYVQWCNGDCAYSGVRADLAGKFSILLDWDALTGELFSLDDRLVNLAAMRTTGLQPLTPSYQEHGIYTPWSSPEFGVGSFFRDGDHWRVVSDGTISLPDGTSRMGTPYSIMFTRTSATLSLLIHEEILNQVMPSIQVTNAPAVLGDAVFAGDFSKDGRVDSRDYVAWRKFSVDETQYNLWRRMFNNSVPNVNGQSAPEPAGFVMVALACLGASTWRRGR